MLKWIVILLKALTIVPAVVSMKRTEVRVQSAYDMAAVFKDEARKSEHNYRTSMRSHITVNNAYDACLQNQLNYELCTCRNCRVLRGLTHGYAKRMRGAIRRDVEAESA